jgi:DNA-directed RNA polymerase subunit RPC12/RpoP
MPLAEPVQRIDGPIRRSLGLVTCPNCRVVVMPRISVKLADKENHLNEALYRCLRCHAEARRWIKL